MIPREIFILQADVYQAMASPVRLEILSILRDGSHSVDSLAKKLGMSQASLSRHLSILRHSMIVNAHRQGKKQIYQLANPKYAQVCDLMRELLIEQLDHQFRIANLPDE